MMKIRFLTAGESHGPALNVIVEGLPAGLPLSSAAVNRELRRRMGGYGRGGRMKIERDRVEWLSGVRFGETLGSPVGLLIRNLDHANWTEAMRQEGERPSDRLARAVSHPRPGHADLAGALKYGTRDVRDILERASARETAARVAAGALCKALLEQAGVRVTSRTWAVGAVCDAPLGEDGFERLWAMDDDAPLRALGEAEGEQMLREIDRSRERGDSVGGVFEVLGRGVPPGLGSHVHWDRRLDARLGGAMLSIQGIKAVSIGEGVEGAGRHGSEHHDPIHYDAGTRRFRRPTNRAGGIEGGISNGETIRVLAYLKPLSTLPRPLESVDLQTKEPVRAARERTDTIPIVAAGVVGEAMASIVLADEILLKFGGDRLDETLRNLRAYEQSLGEF